MNTVAQQTPRPWDGRRMLRFLTGLAILALAVTLRLPGPATVTAAPAELPAPATVAAVSEATAPQIRRSDRVEPQPPAPPVPAVEVVAVPRILPVGEIPQSAGSRAPPAR